MKKKQKPKAYVVCTHCRGTGTIELTGVYADTLALVIRHQGYTGSELARMNGVKVPAMCNRLKAMQRLGVVDGTKYGRKITWHPRAT